MPPQLFWPRRYICHRLIRGLRQPGFVRSPISGVLAFDPIYCPKRKRFSTQWKISFSHLVYVPIYIPPYCHSRNFENDCEFPYSEFLRPVQLAYHPLPICIKCGFSSTFSFHQVNAWFPNTLYLPYISPHIFYFNFQISSARSTRKENFKQNSDFFKGRAGITN